MPEHFANYRVFIAYLVAQRWVAPDHASPVECALAAFENAQRIKGSDAARAAMDKAARKAW